MQVMHLHIPLKGTILNKTPQTHTLKSPRFFSLHQISLPKIADLQAQNVLHIVWVYGLMLIT